MLVALYYGVRLAGWVECARMTIYQPKERGIAFATSVVIEEVSRKHLLSFNSVVFLE